MKAKNMLLIILGILYFSCSSDTKLKTSPEKVTKVTEGASCYAWISGRDSILLSIEIKGNLVSGVLNYNFFEKDDNSGTFNGVLVGDTIFASYKFTSEGILSPRDVAFLRIGDSFVEGFGEMKEQEGRMIFTDRKNIKFNDQNKLTPVDCSFDE